MARAQTESEGNAPAEGVSAYLAAIGRVPLLTAAGEVELGAAIADGRAAEERLAGAVPLGPAECERLGAAAERGRGARRRLVEANLRLVVRTARRYGAPGMALEDLVQEGNLGLLRAAEKFDHSLGFRFSTYATFWIRQAIGRALLDRGAAIRIPLHTAEARARATRMADRLRQELGRDPNDAEVGAELGLTADRVAALRALPRAEASLDEPLRIGEATTLGDAIADPDAVGPEPAAEVEGIRQALRAALGGLTEKERRALALRYGLGGGPARDPAEVGAALGVSRARALQLEARALSKLRRPACADRLRDLAG